MKQCIVFFALVLTIWACGNGGDSTTASSGTTAGGASSAAPVAKIDGKKIYRQNCVTCHGIKGDMGASGAHDLTASELGLEERKLVITKGRGAMTPFEKLLTPEKIAAVAEYTLELKQ